MSNVIPKGAMVVISNGVYDDYQVNGPAITTQDIDIDQLQKDHGEKKERFEKWLYESGLLTPVEHYDLYLGNYIWDELDFRLSHFDPEDEGDV
jgi:hypothetical protein